MKLFIKTFGCQSNEYDSFRIYDFLKRFFKCNLVFTIKEANVVFINICTVREKVEKKSFDFIKKLYYFKIRRKNDLVIICSGCLSSKDLIKKYVDLIIFSRYFYMLPYLLIKCIKNKNYLFEVNFYVEKFDQKNKVGDFFLTYYPKYSFFKSSVCVPISDGCNNNCSYCAVPYSRGFEVCRDSRNIIMDVKYYVENNIQEVVLLGHNVNSYLDKNLIPFHSLLYEVMYIKNLKRVSFLTANPKDFSFELVNLYNEISNLSNHLHLPLQSGSNYILERMKRGYTVEQYRDIIVNLKKRRPTMLFTTDLMVGFPGETMADFLQTLSCVKEFSFDSSFCFIYSPRLNTTAEIYSDNVEFSIKLRRLRILQQVLVKTVQRNTSFIINTRRIILVYGLIMGSVYWGKTDCNRTTLFESSKNYENGVFVEVFILSNINNTLLAKLIM